MNPEANAMINATTACMHDPSTRYTGRTRAEMEKPSRRDPTTAAITLSTWNVLSDFRLAQKLEEEEEALDCAPFTSV